MSLDSRRWVVIVAGIFANLCQGAAYASSIFMKPLVAQFGCTKPQAALAFSLIVACLPIGAIAGGTVADRRGPRGVVIVGSIIFALGMFLAGFAKSLPMIYATYGVMMGIGSGMAYGSIVGASVKWFPDKRGLASGLVVGALGGGPLIIAPIATKIMESAGLFGTFHILGIAFAAIMLIASCFVTAPPKDYVPTGFVPKAPAKATAGGNDLSWTQMVARPWFWLLYVLYALGTFAGLMLISQAVPIAMDITKIDPMQAALVLGALSVANAFGRIFWGGISDKIGRTMALVFMFLITAAVMFLMPTLTGTVPTLIIAFVFAGLCYGGYLGIFPSMCADAFGVKNLTINYGILFSAFSVAGVLGPMVGSSLAQKPGGFNQAFLLAGIIATTGFVIALITKLSESKASKAEA